MAELREAVATREETVVNDVATGMGYALKKDQKAIVLRFVKVKKCKLCCLGFGKSLCYFTLPLTFD